MHRLSWGQSSQVSGIALCAPALQPWLGSSLAWPSLSYQ